MLRSGWKGRKEECSPKLHIQKRRRFDDDNGDDDDHCSHKRKRKNEQQLTIVRMRCFNQNGVQLGFLLRWKIGGAPFCFFFLCLWRKKERQSERREKKGNVNVGWRRLAWRQKRALFASPIQLFAILHTLHVRIFIHFFSEHTTFSTLSSLSIFSSLHFCIITDLVSRHTRFFSLAWYCPSCCTSVDFTDYLSSSYSFSVAIFVEHGRSIELLHHHSFLFICIRKTSYCFFFITTSTCSSHHMQPTSHLTAAFVVARSIIHVWRCFFVWHCAFVTFNYVSRYASFGGRLCIYNIQVCVCLSVCLSICLSLLWLDFVALLVRQVHLLHSNSVHLVQFIRSTINSWSFRLSFAVRVLQCPFDRDREIRRIHKQRFFLYLFTIFVLFIAFSILMLYCTPNSSTRRPVWIWRFSRVVAILPALFFIPAGQPFWSPFFFYFHWPYVLYGPAPLSPFSFFVTSPNKNIFSLGSFIRIVSIWSS